MKHRVKNIFLVIVLASIVTRYRADSQNVTVSPSELQIQTVLGLEIGSKTYEEHKIMTEDGYILTVHRIPGGPDSIPVFLQHGLLESSAFWVIADESKSLAHILAKAGYDVWLGNARGNTYSKGHKYLSTGDARFWDFTWHEIGFYDLPAVIKYIFKLKKTGLHYIGHSMGNTDFCVMASEKPEMQQFIRSFIGLAPAVYEYHLRGPIRLIASLRKPVLAWEYSTGTFEVLGRSAFFNFLATFICTNFLFRGLFCAEPLFFLNGMSFHETNNSLLPLIWQEFPAGTSAKLMDHWYQQINVNKLRQYDYGPEGNMKYYDNLEPPSYDLSRVAVPVAAFWAENDFLVNFDDTENFYNQVPNKMGIFKVADPSFNHFDFLWGIRAPELVYDKVLELLKSTEGDIYDP